MVAMWLTLIGADPADGAPVELHGGARASEVAALDPGATHEAELLEIADQGGDGRPGQVQLGGEPGAGARAVVAQVPQDERELGTPHRAPPTVTMLTDFVGTSNKVGAPDGAPQPVQAKDSTVEGKLFKVSVESGDLEGATASRRPPR